MDHVSAPETIEAIRQVARQKAALPPPQMLLRGALAGGLLAYATSLVMVILAQNLRRTSSSTAALLRYNGCVRGTNTPDCRLYPSKVLARASRVRQEILSSASALATLN